MHDYWEKSPRMSDQQDTSQVVGSPLQTAQQDPHICTEPEQHSGTQEMPHNTPELSLSRVSRTTGPADLPICQFEKKISKNETQNQTKKPQTAWSQHRPHSPGLVSHSPIRSQLLLWDFCTNLSAQEEQNYDTRGDWRPAQSPKIRLGCGERKLAAVFQSRAPW